MSKTSTSSDRYLAPDWFTRRVFNPCAAFLTRRGLSLRGSRVLEVRGRRSGEIRSTVVNLLTGDGVDYLVAPRGTTQGVKNSRVAGGGALRLGRRRDEFRAVELADDAKPEVLRAYLAAWAREVGRFFEGLSATSSDAELLAAAAGFPAFRVDRL